MAISARLFAQLGEVEVRSSGGLASQSIASHRLQHFNKVVSDLFADAERVEHTLLLRTCDQLLRSASSLGLWSIVERVQAYVRRQGFLLQSSLTYTNATLQSGRMPACSPRTCERLWIMQFSISSKLGPSGKVWQAFTGLLRLIDVHRDSRLNPVAISVITCRL